MNDPDSMCFFEDVANLRGNADSFRKRKTTFARESL
jgi:hypothetical protein